MLIRSNLLLTKDEVFATIVKYDYKTNTIIAKVGNKKAIIKPEDISIYQTRKNKGYIFTLLGTTFKCHVENYSKDEGYILSRAKIMEETSKIYNKGDVVNATVVSASDKALYLEFAEGLSGIMYLNDITSAKLKKPLDLFNVGDKIKCIITKKRGDLFELSRTKLYTQPLKIKNGKKVLCTITKKLDDNSGYFVEVFKNPNYSGIFDLTEDNISNKYSVGKNIRLRVIQIKPKKQLKLRTA